MRGAKIAGCALVMALTCAAAARAQDVASFYKGKTVTILVTTSGGGGFDTYARPIARHLGKHIPGNPAVVVQNMPGAGGVVGTNWIAGVGAKDGTILGALHPAALMEPLLGDKSKVKYDPAKFNYVGNANRDVFVCFIRADAPAKTFADALRKELIMGAAGDAASLRDGPTLLNNVLGARMKIVAGYSGSRDIQLAVERGEIHGQCGVAWSALTAVHPEWFSSGLMKPLVQEEITGYPALNAMGVPRSVDFASNDEQRRIFELAYGLEVFGRPYLMAAEVPRDRVEAMRGAFAETLADPEFLGEASKMQLDVEAMSGEKVQRLVLRAFATPADIVVKTRKALGRDE